MTPEFRQALLFFVPTAFACIAAAVIAGLQ